jgi:hypothetical protein
MRKLATLLALAVGGADPGFAVTGHDSAPSPTHFTLINDQVAWHFDWAAGPLRATSFENKKSHHTLTMSSSRELALTFSGAPDRVQEPFVRVAQFQVRQARALNSTSAVFELDNDVLALEVTLRIDLKGPTRCKWVGVKNRTGRDLLLLDVDLDEFLCECATSGGGQGQPVFMGDDAFAAVEHPTGDNRGAKGQVQLSHHPGRRLAPGGAFQSQVAVVSVAPPGLALEHFLSYVQSKSLRPRKVMSIYTPFGINNQWGACPTLDDEQTLDVLKMLEHWQRRGMRFDYFTLDTGWVDPNSDLTRFRPTCYPNGPWKIIERVDGLGMKFGLWFATTWAAESCWDYPPALAGQERITMPYRLGYPDKAHEGHQFCFAREPFFNTLSNAVLYHIKENHVRFVKFDGGVFSCNQTNHGHLPGKYATEQMHNQLISLAGSIHAAAPDVRIMWYYGCSSPFWALYGDFIFESGLSMEGSGTSAFPTLYYRDSVTLMQDQVAQYARTIPPLVKDSLGVWLADTRWGNFMGKERWREALVMDLGRGSLLFPNLWGDLYLLDDADVDFLAHLAALAKQNEALFLHRHKILGDPWHNEVYGYAYCQGTRGFLFVNNAHFAARPAELSLDASLGLDAAAGSPLRVVSHFPEQTRLLRPDGIGFRLGDKLDLWLRPFEVLMLEVTPSSPGSAAWPKRLIAGTTATNLGIPLALEPAFLDPRLEMKLADAARLAQKKLSRKTYVFETVLPTFEGETPPALAITVRLRKGDADWKYAPLVAEILQALATIGDQNVQFVPVPDGRQFGNTQSFGGSWIVYHTRLGRQWSGQKLKLAIHAYLPEGVEALTQAWVVKPWWNESRRPSADGYYNDAPS